MAWLAWLGSVLVHLVVLVLMASATWSLDTGADDDEFDVNIVVTEPGPDQSTLFQHRDKQIIEPRRIVKAPDKPDRVPEKIPDELLSPAQARPLPKVNAIALADAAATGAPRFRVSIPVPAGARGGARTGFFGVKARGHKFVYVLDRSGSMAARGNLQRAKRELLRSLGKLSDTAKFQIIFYNDKTQLVRITGRYSLVPVTDQSRASAAEGIGDIEPSGGTEPRPALLRALALGADVIFFLTDAEQIAPAMVDEIIRKITMRPPGSRAKIHTIEFGIGPRMPTSHLAERLSRSSKGTYRYINTLDFRDGSGP